MRVERVSSLAVVALMAGMTIVAISVFAAMPQVRLDVPWPRTLALTPLPSDGVGSRNLLETLRIVASEARTPIGVQLARPTDSLPQATAAQAQAGTLGAALEALVPATGGYEWRVVDSIIVVRPKRAWHDPDDLLNQTVPPLRLEHDTLNGVMQQVTHRLYGRGGSAEKAEKGGALTAQFRGGSLLELMAFAARLDGKSVWVVSFAPTWGSGSGQPNAKFGIALMDFDGHFTASGFVKAPPGVGRSR